MTYPPPTPKQNPYSSGEWWSGGGPAGGIEGQVREGGQDQDKGKTLVGQGSRAVAGLGCGAMAD